MRSSCRAAIAAPEASALLLSAAALLLAVALPILALAGLGDSLPAWDEAKYAVGGLRLLLAAQDLDPLGFAAETNALSVWPPFFPWLQAVAFAAADPSPATARRLAALLFAGLLLATLWVPRRTWPAAGPLAALPLAVWPLLQTFAALAMLEVACVLLAFLAFGSYCRAVDGEGRGSSERWWRATWLFSTLLFFCKYNHGLLWLAPLLAHEFWRRQGAPPLAAWLRLQAGLLRPRSATAVLAWAVAAIALALRLTGGGSFHLGPFEVRLHSAGNLVYALLVAVVLLELYRWARDRAGVAARWRDFDRRWQGLGRWLLAPILLWLLLPPHTKDLVAFLENRSSGLGLVEGLLFYPRAFAAGFAPGWGWALLGAGAAGVFRLLASRPGPATLLAWVTGLSWLALLAHGYKQERFMIPAAAWLVLAAAVVLADLVQARRFAPLTAALLLVAGLAARPFDAGRHRALVAAASAPPATATQVDAVLRGCASQPSGRCRVAGTWNLLSPWLIEWQALRARLPAPERIRTTRGRVVAPTAGGVAWVVLPPPAAGSALRQWSAENTGMPALLASLEEAGYREEHLVSGLRLYRLNPDR